MSAQYIIYQTVRDDEGEEVEADRWTNDTLRDALRDLSNTRTAHCGGVQYQVARYQHSATAIFTVVNGTEFRTACTEERELAIIGISRWSARRLARLLGCEWQA